MYVLVSFVVGLIFYVCSNIFKNVGRLKEMIDFLSERLIKDYDNVQDDKVRGRYGILCSVLSIILNLIMAGFKLILGFITHSVAILADGFNNLSDVAGNVAALFGFVVALKNPDKEHPFGHGRMEYLASLMIAFLILFVGARSFWDSVKQIMNPEMVYFNTTVAFILLLSIIVKCWMGHFNLAVGKKIDSKTLIAASKDSLNDALATVATLIALIISMYTHLPVDGLLGTVVSLIILKTGYGICKETVASLLGAAPDAYLLEKLRMFISSYDRVIGTHDLMIHDYGPGRRYLTVHVEVNKNEEMMAIHDVIDKIERDIYQKFKIKATVHLDPVDLDDELTRKLKKLTMVIIQKINVNYSIHDFRISHCINGTTLVFDVTIPADDVTSHGKLIEQINHEIKKYDAKFNTLIQIDHSYT